ncbi:MAG TPA: hypothetical protein VI387_01075 [Candidatus Brocadiales bacterium]|nr:hypothetical protein [Candidatus Brocadiales bacterium]
MLKNIVYLIGLVILASSIGCGNVTTSKVKEGEIIDDIQMENIQKDFIETIGIGAADANLTNKTQRRSLSRDAAIIKARHEMLSVIKGLRLTGDETVEKAIVTNSKLGTEVDALIKGAEIIRTQWTSDDGCVVTLRLHKKKLDKTLKQYQQ